MHCGFWITWSCEGLLGKESWEAARHLHINCRLPSLYISLYNTGPYIRVTRQPRSSGRVPDFGGLALVKYKKAHFVPNITYFDDIEIIGMSQGKCRKMSLIFIYEIWSRYLGCLTFDCIKMRDNIR